VRRLEQLRADLLVARGAGFILQLARGGLVRADRRIIPAQRHGRARTGRAVQDVAVVARDVVLLVLARIPEREVTVALVTRLADSGFFLGGNLLVVETEDSADAFAATPLDVLGRVAVAALAVRALQVALLTVYGLGVVVDLTLVPALDLIRF